MGCLKITVTTLLSLLIFCPFFSFAKDWLISPCT